ncbi:hypothetical protein G4B88_021134 [Cannabis sativa]|nr:hypothetical protein G4B88_021134 [Cannabis sativa]
MFRVGPEYDKYWRKLNDCNEALLFALVLDPRYKLYSYEVRMQRDGERGGTNDSQNHQVLIPQSLNHKLNLSMTWFFLIHLSSRPKGKKSRNVHDEFVARRMEKNSSKMKNELDKYIEEEAKQPTQRFDILGWWASSG